MWSNSIEISIATGKIGGAMHRQALSDEIAKRGFRLTGDRNFGPSRERLEEMARLTLANIGDTLAGVHLPRLDVIAEVDAALDQHRVVEVCGDAGVGKSGVLRHVAERVARWSEERRGWNECVSTCRSGWCAYH